MKGLPGIDGGPFAASGRERALMEAELHEQMGEHDNPKALRSTADIFERWANQLRFKADCQEGFVTFRLFKDYRRN